jgi:hypothetical protein
MNFATEIPVSFEDIYKNIRVDYRLFGLDCSMPELIYFLVAMADCFPGYPPQIGIENGYHLLIYTRMLKVGINGRGNGNINPDEF